MLEDKPHWWIGKDSLGIGKSLMWISALSMTSPRKEVPSSILIKCLPPYIMKWIGLLMSVTLLQ